MLPLTSGFVHEKQRRNNASRISARARQTSRVRCSPQPCWRPRARIPMLALNYFPAILQRTEYMEEYVTRPRWRTGCWPKTRR